MVGLASWFERLRGIAAQREEDRAWAEHWQLQMDNAQDASMFEQIERLMEEARLKSIATAARPQCRPDQMTQEMWENMRNREAPLALRGTTEAAFQELSTAFNDVGRVAASSLRGSFDSFQTAMALTMGVDATRLSQIEPPRERQRPTHYDELDSAERNALYSGFRTLQLEYRPEVVDYRPSRMPVQERLANDPGDAWVERSSFGGSHSYINLGGGVVVCVARTVNRVAIYVRDIMMTAIQAFPVGSNSDLDSVCRIMETHEMGVTLDNIAGALEIHFPTVHSTQWLSALVNAQTRKVSTGAITQEMALPIRAPTEEPRYVAQVTITYEAQEAFLEGNHGRLRTPQHFHTMYRSGWISGNIRVADQESALAMELAASMYGPNGLQLIAALPNRVITIERNVRTRCYEYAFTSTDQAAIERLTGARQQAIQQVQIVAPRTQAPGTVVDRFEVNLLGRPDEVGADRIAVGPNSTFESMPVRNRAEARMAHWLWENQREYVDLHRGNIVTVVNEYTPSPPRLEVVVTRRIMATVPTQTPEVPAQSERRLKLSHKQRNDQDVTHAEVSESRRPRLRHRK